MPNCSAGFRFFFDALIRGFELSASIKLNLTEERTLINICLHPDEPMGIYSKQAGLSKGSFTFVADSLEKKGLVTRTPMAGDRRVYTLVSDRQRASCRSGN